MTSKVSIKLVFDLFVAYIGLLAANLKLITFLMEPKELTWLQNFQLPDAQCLCL